MALGRRRCYLDRRGDSRDVSRAGVGDEPLCGREAHLEGLGYEVKGEVCGCDIVALEPGPPILVISELKMSFTLELFSRPWTV